MLSSSNLQVPSRIPYGRDGLVCLYSHIFGPELTQIPVDLREKAIEVALSLVSGAWQTSLVSYFTHQDLFPALMKVSIAKTVRSPMSLCVHIFKAI